VNARETLERIVSHLAERGTPMSFYDYMTQQERVENDLPLSLSRRKGWRLMMRGAHLEGADFQSADLRGARFDNCFLNRANFIGADLRNVDFWQSQLEKSDFTGAKLNVSQFISADVQDAKFVGADIREAWLNDAAHLDTADLTGAIVDAYQYIQGWVNELASRSQYVVYDPKYTLRRDRHRRAR